MGLTSVPGIELVGEVPDILDVLMALKQGQADVVITSTSDEDLGMNSHVFAQFPDATLLVLGPDADAYIEQRCRHRWRFPGQSAEEIADALRFAIENPCELNPAAAAG
jgi:hypothetical protein